MPSVAFETPYNNQDASPGSTVRKPPHIFSIFLDNELSQSRRLNKQHPRSSWAGLFSMPMRQAFAALAVLVTIVSSAPWKPGKLRQSASTSRAKPGLGAAAMPLSCQPSQVSPVARAEARFEASNRPCMTAFDSCVQNQNQNQSSSLAACAATCDYGLQELAHDCRAVGHGLFCRYEAYSHATEGSQSLPFVVRSAICLPNTCSRDQAAAVQAALQARLCGPLAGTMDCRLSLTCDFGLSSGAIIGIVIGAIAAFCILVAAGICCTRLCEDDDDVWSDAGEFDMTTYASDVDDANDVVSPVPSDERDGTTDFVSWAPNVSSSSRASAGFRLPSFVLGGEQLPDSVTATELRPTPSRKQVVSRGSDASGELLLEGQE